MRSRLNDVLLLSIKAVEEAVTIARSHAGDHLLRIVKI